MGTTRCASPRYPRRTPTIHPVVPPVPAASRDTHQVRNSLASIISSAECLRRRLSDDAHRRYIDDIIRSARQGASSLSILETFEPSAFPS